MSVLEAKLVITATDRTGAAFKEIEERVARISTMSKEIGKAAGSVAGMSGGATLAAEFERAEKAASHFATTVRTASESVAAISHNFDSVASHAARAEKHVSAMGRAAHMIKHAVKEVSPLVMGGAGFKMIEATAHFTREGMELQHERVASMNAGRTPEQLKDFQHAAQSTAVRVPTASYVESMKTLLETTSAFGSPEHAMEHLDFMMRTASVLKSASGGKVEESAGEMGQQFAKFFEMRGAAMDPHRFEHEGNEMVRAMAATGGTFNPREMFNFAKQAKSALRNYDEEYLSKVVPSIVGETGGDRAGTAANAWYNVIMGKARDKKQAELWLKAGLLDKSKVTMDPKGNVVSWAAGAVKGTDLAMKNPLQWFEEVELPALRDKLKVNVDDTGELSKIHTQMYRNSMSNQFANENSILADRIRLHKDADLYKQTSSPEEMYQRNLGQDPTAAFSALTASFNSFGAALTQPIMAKAASVMSSVAGGLMSLGQALSHLQEAHPDLAERWAGAAVGGGMLAGGALGYGAFTNLTSGFGLKGAAADLTAAAEALKGAAASQGKGGPWGSTPDAPDISRKLKMPAGMVVGQLANMMPDDGQFTDMNGKPLKPMSLTEAAGSIYGQIAARTHNPFAGSRSGSGRDSTLGSSGGFDTGPGTLTTHGFNADRSDYSWHQDTGRTPLGLDPNALAGAMSGALAGLKATVEGPVTAELQGAVQVGVNVTVTPSGELIKAAASAKAAASGNNVKASVGTSLPEAAPGGASGKGAN